MKESKDIKKCRDPFETGDVLTLVMAIAVVAAGAGAVGAIAVVAAGAGAVEVAFVVAGPVVGVVMMVAVAMSRYRR